jgi:hypothetical protein
MFFLSSAYMLFSLLLQDQGSARQANPRFPALISRIFPSSKVRKMGGRLFGSSFLKVKLAVLKADLIHKQVLAVVTDRKKLYLCHNIISL